jgi:hypothetical protein
MYLFNNCRNHQHATLYGDGAFYDLDRTGSQAKVARRLANNLVADETCIVASLDEPTGDIVFEWFRFSGERSFGTTTGCCVTSILANSSTPQCFREVRHNGIQSTASFLMSMVTSNGRPLGGLPNC